MGFLYWFFAILERMTGIQKNLLIGLAGAAVIAAGGYWYLHIYSATGIFSLGATTTPVSVGGVSVTGTGSSTVEVINTNTPPPSLDRPITISASLQSDAAQILRTQITTLVTQLRTNPTRVDLWLQLGIDRKIGGDYAGAVEAWNYVAVAAPLATAYVAYGDLGDLYMNFIKDYPKAEENYKTAISINPRVIGYYQDLYTLYHYLYKTNTTAAADIIREGLVNNPGNQDLLNLQAQMNAVAH